MDICDNLLFSIDKKTGIWKGIGASSFHLFDSSFCLKLSKFFKKEKAISIVDLGCGMGQYVKNLRKDGFICDGFDGNPNTFQLTCGLCDTVELTKPNLELKLKYKKYDWVLSLEVGEHIPKKYENRFLSNLASVASKGIVLSWAVLGQGGDGHINEQSNEYIEKKMKSLSFKRDKEAEIGLRESTTNCIWFKETVMVYRNNQKM